MHNRIENEIRFFVKENIAKNTYACIIMSTFCYILQDRQRSETIAAVNQLKVFLILVMCWTWFIIIFIMSFLNPRSVTILRTTRLSVWHTIWLPLEVILPCLQTLSISPMFGLNLKTWTKMQECSRHVLHALVYISLHSSGPDAKTRKMSKE